MIGAKASRVMLQTAMILSLALLYIPILTLVTYSFLGFSQSGHLTFDAYRALVQDEELLDALMTSFMIAVSSATVSTVVGGLAALVLEREAIPGRRFIDAVTWIPLVLPEVVFGVGLLVWFVFLRISLGSLSLVIAHVTFSISYVVMTVRQRARLLDPALDDAARDLGANGWHLFTKVQLPLMFPGLIAGWMMAFTISFDDFLISFFPGGPDTTTLPLALYSRIRFGVTPEIFAMASFIFGVSFISAVAVSRHFSPSRSRLGGRH